MIVVGVSKTYWNRGKDSHWHPRGKPFWAVYGYDNGKFVFKRINFADVIRYKMQVKKIQKFVCKRCGYKFNSVKGSNPDCPQCV